MSSLPSAKSFRVFLTCTPQKPQGWGMAGANQPAEQRLAYQQAGGDLAELVDRAEDAEIIIFFEPWQIEEQTWQPSLRAHPLVRSRPNDCFVVCNDDEPLGFLPGVYASLPQSRFNPARHRAWNYRKGMNHVLNSEDPAPQYAAPELLATFSGARSHRCRNALFNCAPGFPDSIKLVETRNLQFNIDPSSEDKRAGQLAFNSQIRAARFSLCPRGAGTSSYRIQESMQLGRAPVIISDEWVPGAGPDWDQFSLRIAEDRIAELPAILTRLAPQWETMGRLARANWEQYFRPAHYAHQVIDTIIRLWLAKPHSEPLEQARWEEMICRHRLATASRGRTRLKARLQLLRLATRQLIRPSLRAKR